MQTLKFKPQTTNAFFATVNQTFGGFSRLLPSTVSLSEPVLNDLHDYCSLGSSRKLGGAAEHLIDGSEKRICRLSFECY